MLKRKTPLRRKRHLPRTPVSTAQEARLITSASLAVADDSLEVARRRDWLGRQPCAFGRLVADPCSGNIQRAHQDEGKGVGIKTHWSTEIPLCRRHHEMLGGTVRHTLVIPLQKLLARAFHRLAAEQTEAAWQEVQAHQARRKGLL